MEAELAALVTSGATTAVGLMVTDSWQQAKERLVRLFARGGDAGTVDGELDRSQDALAAAAGTPDEEILASDIAAMLRLRLRALLQDHPGAAAELRCLVEEFSPDATADASGAVHNSISGGTVHGPVLQGRSFSNVTFHAPRPTAE
ncbi:hypothetical protein [Streptomyces sp. TLI_55]|uniref:hypothetical protein n=1 Tax=Streptomyces sp. TLI_55 TaxID=1938861 RepID=UPI000BE33E06|nr:hypothetical protein [Streptomyces sp. TLI_55]